MMRKVVILLCLLLLSSAAVADEWEDLAATLMGEAGMSPKKIEASQALLSKYPPNAQMAGDPRIEEAYAQAAVTVALQLGYHEHRYDEALGATSTFLAAFPWPITAWGGAVDLFQVRYLRETNPSSEQALQAAQAAVQRLRKGCPVFHMPGWFMTLANYVNGIVDLYKHAGQLEEAAKFLQDLPLWRPDIDIQELWYWQRRVEMHTLLGQAEEGQQAAMLAFRLGAFDENQVNGSLKLLLDALALSDSRSQVGAFLQYLKTGQGDNPLADIPMPEFSEEQLNQLLLQTGGAFPKLVTANLYAGRFDRALKAAQYEVVSISDSATAGIADIARCFKAKDMHLLRANQFIQWVKTGEGTNPLEDF